ncbi:hypothetical protein BC835DRAFT_1322969 [Cytidiella melzeri]|nr:hypothetical protein BC835DRAFT_1322969 [Cytidiella melzeri]
MRLSTSLVLFAAIVTGAFHTVTVVSAIPHSDIQSRDPTPSSPDTLSKNSKGPSTGDSHLYDQFNDAADLPSQVRRDVLHSDDARATVLHSRTTNSPKTLKEIFGPDTTMTDAKLVPMWKKLEALHSDGKELPMDASPDEKKLWDYLKRVDPKGTRRP